jgi:hypothetical protein
MGLACSVVLLVWVRLAIQATALMRKIATPAAPMV